MQLAKFDSEAEQSYFLETMKSTFPEGKIIWLAGNDIVNEGTWRWANNNDLVNINLAWGPGQPDNSGGKENCLHLHKYFLLNDNVCNLKYPFMCQRVFEHFKE